MTDFEVRLLDLPDVPRYIAHMLAVQSESGRDGRGHAHAYVADDIFDIAAAETRELERWTKPLDLPGWRRAWGLFAPREPREPTVQAEPTLVGHLYLAGGSIHSELHRAGLGMALRSTHHRCGGGRLLLQTAISWSQSQAGLDWLDLGVYADNEAAQELYLSAGFQERGRIPDRYRLGSTALEEISMTRWIGERTPAGIGQHTARDKT